MVGIVGSGHPIGTVLEVLLRAAGFEARFPEASDPERLGEALAGFRLGVVRLASRSGKEAVTGLLATRMPVLELVRNGDEDGRSRESSISCPCRVEVLGEAIRATLQPAVRGHA